MLKKLFLLLFLAALSAACATDPALVSLYQLPPSEGSDNKDTLLGTDVNNNGIRDDVELAIAKKYGPSQKLVLAIGDYMRGAQVSLTITTRPDAAAIFEKNTERCNCIMAILEEKKMFRPYSTSGDFLGVVSPLLFKQMNTQARAVARDNYNRLLSGSGARMTTKKGLAACSFDAAALPN